MMNASDLQGAMVSVVGKFSALDDYLTCCKAVAPCWPQFADRIAAAAKAGKSLPTSSLGDRSFVHDANNLLGDAMLNLDMIEMPPDLAAFYARFGVELTSHVDKIGAAINRVSQMLKPLNMLIVDDNSDFAEVLQMGLEARKHTCDIYLSASKEAQIAMKTADAVFLDCSLPGVELQDVISQVGAYCDKIILISGAELFMLPYAKTLVNQKTVAGFLKKPFSASDIEQHARSVFLSSLAFDN